MMNNFIKKLTLSQVHSISSILIILAIDVGATLLKDLLTSEKNR